MFSHSFHPITTTSVWAPLGWFPIRLILKYDDVTNGPNHHRLTVLVVLRTLLNYLYMKWLFQLDFILLQYLFHS